MAATNQTHETVAVDAQDDDLDTRSIKALTQHMTVIDNCGDVAGNDSLYEVTTESGACYTVDLENKSCTCPDHEYRGEHCKHLRRVEFESGEVALPSWLSFDAVDDQFGEHITTGEPRIVMTDGGATAHKSSDSSAERYDPRDDYILIGVDADGAHHIYRTKDEHILVVEDGEVTQNYDLETTHKSVNDWIDFVQSRVDGGFENQHLYKTARGALMGAI